MPGSTPRGRGLPDQEAGKPISAKWLTTVKRAALGDTAAGPGMVEVNVGGRKVLRPVGAGAFILKTPPGGIDAATRAGTAIVAGVADCTLYEPTEDGWDLSDPATTLEVWNMAVGAAVAGSADIQAKVIDGRLMVDWELCT